MNRRAFNQKLLLVGGGLLLGSSLVVAKNYLSAEQAMQTIWPGLKMTPFSVELSEAEMKAIKKASKTRVRSQWVKGYRSIDNQWLIIDQVVGKHEFIDLAIGLDAQGAVTGVEILTYRESYGDEVRNPKWQAQFYGKDSSEVLLLDQHIKNISGATMSCRHITDGVNRLTQTWALVLKNLA
ncbi:MAG: FMN-binding protein [Marinicella sp.]|nr:FMN-binding protein [Xanthomonadales bacterium]